MFRATCVAAVLDDITRAPGEALNVLLRLLNERTFEGRALPLRCAIATANAPRDDMYVEPLDPANLDRFALQARCDGLLMHGNWAAVRDVVQRFAHSDGGNLQPSVCESPADTATLKDMEGDRESSSHGIALLQISSVEMGHEMQEMLVEALQWLSTAQGINSRNSLVTDRTFLVRAPRVIRAAAALAGRAAVEAEDLLSLRHMTTFRVPPAVHEGFAAHLREMVAAHKAAGAGRDDGDSSAGPRSPADGSKQPAGSSQGGKHAPSEAAAHATRASGEQLGLMQVLQPLLRLWDAVRRWRRKQERRVQVRLAMMP